MHCTISVGWERGLVALCGAEKLAEQASECGHYAPVAHVPAFLRLPAPQFIFVSLSKNVPVCAQS